MDRIRTPTPQEDRIHGIVGDRAILIPAPTLSASLPTWTKIYKNRTTWKTAYIRYTFARGVLDTLPASTYRPMMRFLNTTLKITTNIKTKRASPRILKTSPKSIFLGRVRAAANTAFILMAVEAFTTDRREKSLPDIICCKIHMCRSIYSPTMRTFTFCLNGL